MTDDGSAAGLLRTVGLLPDGPVRWGRPVPARGPGIYLVELPGPLAAPPLEMTRLGKWIERLPRLRLDGARPTSKALAGRLAALWLPGATVLYAGATDGRIGGRVTALVAHALGDRAPHADGQWLHALRGLEHLRIWWAATDAPQEYLDAILDAFGAAVLAAGPLPPGRPVDALLLPWATTRRPTGERQVHGLTGSVVPAETLPVSPAPGTIVTDLPPGDADGAVVEPKGTGTARRATPPASKARATARSGAAGSAVAGSALGPAASRTPSPVHLSAAALERLRSELDELTRVRRPEVVTRVATARELGDLRENAEYHSAREEHSFLEGRIRNLEHKIRYAAVIDDAADHAESGLTDDPAPVKVRIGSRVTVEQDGEALTYSIVGSTEADPAAGRISDSSPVGAALLGALVGADVVVRTPRGQITLRVIAVE